MGQRHKHADVIIAWANGEEVQIFNPNTKQWLDLTFGAPTFMEEEYRIKPRPVLRKYRVASFIRGSRIYTSTVDSEWDESVLEKGEDFVRWLTDWIEYEVEE